MAARKPLHPGLTDIAPRQVIDKNSPVPLHYQLELFLRSGIESGRFPPQQSLPTELELQEFFGLSRTSIRQAIGKLAADGLVERRRSLGTIVLPQPFQEELSSLTSFTEEVLRRGHTPQTRLVDFTIRPADAEDQKYLNLAPGAEVYDICRVRHIDDSPIGLIRSRLPVALLPDLTPDVFSVTGLRQSIYYILETVYHFKLVRADEIIHAVTLTEGDAELLALPPATAVLQRHRVTYDAEDRAVALERGLYHVRYHLEWKGREVMAFDRRFNDDSDTAST